jgi:zinc finger HIT domain-containing protein 1
MGGEDMPGVGVAKARSRDIISDRKPGPGVSGKRKSTLNVRGALLYKKNIQQLIEESVRIVKYLF